MKTKDEFACVGCGACCRVTGYVRLRPDETSVLSLHMGMSETEFTQAYTRLTHDRQGLSLIEKEDGSCVFLTDTDGCLVNEAKPRQCKDFPHTWNFEGWEKSCKGSGKDFTTDNTEGTDKSSRLSSSATQILKAASLLGKGTDKREADLTAGSLNAHN